MNQLFRNHFRSLDTRKVTRLIKLKILMVINKNNES
jgi:hypothetical protein